MGDNGGNPQAGGARFQVGKHVARRAKHAAAQRWRKDIVYGVSDNLPTPQGLSAEMASIIPIDNPTARKKIKRQSLTFKNKKREKQMRFIFII